MAKSATEWVEHFDAEIANKHDEAQAILDTVSASDNGEWTPEQKSRYEEIVGPPGEESKGMIAKLQGQRGMWENTRREHEKLQQNRNLMVAEDLQAHRQVATPQVPRNVHTGVGIYCMESTRPVTIPTRARAHKPLNSTLWETPEHAYAAGHWFMAALFDWDPSVKFCKDHGIDLIRDQQEIGTPGKGGYLVPTELERTIIRIREQYGVMRSKARVYPMMAETKDLPKDLGGIVVAPAAERSDLKANNETTKDWIRPQLVARKWAGYTTWSNELDEDAIIDIGADLAVDYGRAFAFAEDGAGFNGDGGAGFNSITGIRSALLASSTKTAAVNTGASDLVLEDFLQMIAATPNTEVDQQAWYMHKSVWAQSVLPLSMADGSGYGGNTIRDMEAGANVSPGGTGRQPNFFWQGYPGYFVNVMPTAADFAADLVGPVIFGDLMSGIAMGSRRGVTIRTSAEAEFATDEMAIRGTERFDIIVHETGTATSTDPAGTIVMLNLPGV